MLDFLFFVAVPDFGLFISDRVFAATEEGDLGDRAGDFAVFVRAGLEFEIVDLFVVILLEEESLLFVSFRLPCCSFSEAYFFASTVPSSFSFCGVFFISILSS